MRGRFFLLVIVSFLIWSCEDPTTLTVSKIFSSNKLQTVYSDTFSVVTSVVQLDSVLTNGSGTILLGKYNDKELGTIAANSYFQVGYNAPFIMDSRFTFDSVVLVLPYNHVFVGDTSKSVTVNLYQLSEQMTLRTIPNVNAGDLKISFFSGNGFYNTSTFDRESSPIISKALKFFPHKDTVTIRLPDSFGLKWFKFAQRLPDSGNSGTDSTSYLDNVSKFVNLYFKGFNIDVDPSTDACIVGFNVDKMKLRFYYKNYSGDLYKQTHFDFHVVSVDKLIDQQGTSQLSTDNFFQFNHIDYDRSTAQPNHYLSSLPVLQPRSTLNTGNLGFVQSGTGLVTRLDFPSLKKFFSINNGVILNSAFLEVYPAPGSYTKDFLPLSSLQLYTTDISNFPLRPVSGGSASIQYDFEFGKNTLYRYQLFPFLYQEINSTENYITPLIIGPAGIQGGSLQRVYIGDRFYPDTFYNGTKIKLKLYYSYALN